MKNVTYFSHSKMEKPGHIRLKQNKLQQYNSVPAISGPLMICSPQVLLSSAICSTHGLSARLRAASLHTRPCPLSFQCAGVSTVVEAAPSLVASPGVFSNSDPATRCHASAAPHNFFMPSKTALLGNIINPLKQPLNSKVHNWIHIMSNVTFYFCSAAPGPFCSQSDCKAFGGSGRDGC